MEAKPDKTHVDQKLGIEREVYSERTECPSSALQDWASLRLGEQLQVDTASVDEATDRVRGLMPELEIAGSGDVRDLSR